MPFPVVSDYDKGAGDAGTRKSTGTDVFALTIDWHLDFATFTSISAYSAYDLLSTGDTDIAAAPSLHRTRWEDYEQYSQELRLVSPGGETIDWIAGAYYQRNELDISRRLETIDFLQSGLFKHQRVVSTRYRCSQRLRSGRLKAGQCSARVPGMPLTPCA